MRRWALSVFFLVLPSKVFALQFNIKGHDRIEVNFINNIDTVSGGVGGSGYWTHRLYLKPTLLVDDHFSIFTEWKVLNYNKATGIAPNVGSKFGSADGTSADQGAPYPNSLTDTNHSFAVTRAWLEWTSDWGLMRGGRAPRHWGLGMIYNSGDGPEYDYQFTEDTIQYMLPLGFVTFSVGFGKIYEGNVSTDDDDSEDYFTFIQYDNPEIELEAGFLYNRGVRNSTNRNDFHLLNIYGIKEWGAINLKLSGEFGYAFGSSGGNDQNGFAFLGKGDWTFSRYTTRVTLIYASGDVNTTDNNHKDFRYFSQNIRPALILFREDVGGLNTGSFDTIRGGSYVGGLERKGAMLVDAGEDFKIANGLVAGLDFTYGVTEQRTSSGSRNLGLEIDVSGSYQWYENFQTVLEFGYLVTGKAFGTTGDVWAIFSKGVLTF